MPDSDLYFMVTFDESAATPAMEGGSIVSGRLLHDQDLMDIVDRAQGDFPLVLRFLGYVTDFVEPEMIDDFVAELVELRGLLPDATNPDTLKDLDFLIELGRRAAAVTAGIQVHGP